MTMDKDHKEKVEMEEHVHAPESLSFTREELDEFGCAARCSGCVSMLRG